MKDKASHQAWENYRRVYQDKYSKLQSQFEMIFSKENLLEQNIIDVHNPIRRSGALILLYLGELNRMKAKFEI